MEKVYAVCAGGYFTGGRIPDPRDGHYHSGDAADLCGPADPVVPAFQRSVQRAGSIVRSGPDAGGI